MSLQHLYGRPSVMTALRAGIRPLAELTLLVPPGYTKPNGPTKKPRKSAGQFGAHQPEQDLTVTREVEAMARELGVKVTLTTDRHTLNALAKQRTHGGMVLATGEFPLNSISRLMGPTLPEALATAVAPTTPGPAADSDPSDAGNSATVYNIQVTGPSGRRGLKPRSFPPGLTGGSTAHHRWPVWLALDEVVDPQNLGSILRSAYYFGVDGVALCTRNSAPLSPVVSRASAGSLEAFISPFPDGKDQKSAPISERADQQPLLYNVQAMTRFLAESRINSWDIIGTVGPDFEPDVQGLTADRAPKQQPPTPTLAEASLAALRASLPADALPEPEPEPEPTPRDPQTRFEGSSNMADLLVSGRPGDGESEASCPGEKVLLTVEDLSELEIRRPTIIVLGNEGRGMRTNVARLCNRLVSVPRVGRAPVFANSLPGGSEEVVDSLNVGVATGVILSEVVRQAHRGWTPELGSDFFEHNLADVQQLDREIAHIRSLKKEQQQQRQQQEQGQDK
ncbi:hypothetical protein H696_03794 [Fonticula alba]|uniref:tRNA/rRNA methyltransferase SpoU type domain-containing protein n=1 Tax=Fonticula alba TaxID=691883 RepID=A0A058Z603_FONAL|nr:hypothetical protein H696_03794 [Fonticula alba]KCV69363.1 hypothetical protein H696_03794 [Fonticula alba]|eukprot:XP_009495928.1 hypothetical protein H696_03794 [Fonticula alba]